MKMLPACIAALFTLLLCIAPVKAADAPVEQNIGVFGDSLGDGLWSGLYIVTKKHPEVKLFRRTKVGTGLTRGDFATWITEFSTQLDTDHPTVAVVMFGANDQQSIRDENHKGFLFKSEGWKRTYTAHIAAMFAEFEKRKIPVIWVGLPIMRDATMNEGGRYLDDLFAEQAKLHNGTFVPLVDTFKGADGNFASHLPDATGKLHNVRADDGVHFTPYGYELIGEKVYATINAAKPAPVPAAATDSPAPAAAAPAEAPVAVAPPVDTH
ncbi:MAG: DUF459 domain-containing protein [Alphaproteobacteria bacterium]